MDALQGVVVQQSVLAGVPFRAYAVDWDDVLQGADAVYGVGYAPVLGNIAFAKSKGKAESKTQASEQTGITATPPNPKKPGDDDEKTPWYEIKSKDLERSQHGNKHVPPKNANWKDVVNSTKNGSAKYKPDVDIDTIERLAWDEGTPITSGRTWKVKEFDYVIGACSGKETQYMRIELTNNNTVIHGHPITYEEYIFLLK